MTYDTMPQGKGKEIDQGETSGAKENEMEVDQGETSGAKENDMEIDQGETSGAKENEMEIDQGETSGANDHLIESFQKNQDSHHRLEILYTRPTIVWRNNTLTESVQNYKKPRLLSIGPLHRGDVNLQPMEDFKWRFVYILKNSNERGFNATLKNCFDELKKLEEESRRTYNTTNVDMTSDDFVQMLFLDACFIILLTLAELERHFLINPADPVKRSSLEELQNALLQHSKIKKILTELQSLNVDVLIEDVTRDMIILENQIPFFVLEYMWEWFLRTLEINSTLNFLGCFVERERIMFPEQIQHYLHLYHCRHVPFPSQSKALYGRYHRPWIPSATVLKESGIHFRLENPGDHLRFEKGVVRIPERFLDEDFLALAHNLVDFEQSARGFHSTYYSNYVWIMSRLLSKEDDMSILSKRSSFRYKGWDKDVHRYFNDLERRCSFWKVGSELEETISDIDVYTSSRRRRWGKTLQRKLCCSDQWYTITVYGAIVLFILTFLQTFFTIYSYFHPRSSRS